MATRSEAEQRRQRAYEGRITEELRRLASEDQAEDSASPSSEHGPAEEPDAGVIEQTKDWVKQAGEELTMPAHARAVLEVPSPTLPDRPIPSEPGTPIREPEPAPVPDPGRPGVPEPQPPEEPLPGAPEVPEPDPKGPETPETPERPEPVVPP